MYTLLMIVHVVVCLFLIVTILLQTGRGAGLTEMFGGDTAQSILGTQAPKLLKKATAVSAIAFIVTSMVLGMITARTSRSLFDVSGIPGMPFDLDMDLPSMPEAGPVDLDGHGVIPPAPGDIEEDIPLSPPGDEGMAPPEINGS